MKFAPYNRIGGKDILGVSPFYSFSFGFLEVVVYSFLSLLIFILLFHFIYDSFKITYDNTLMQTLLMKPITDAL